MGAQREQLHRLREVEDPDDFYAPMAKRFGQDPHRTDEPALEVLRGMARPGETWLDIGSGGGRYSLPLALLARRVLAVEPSPSMLAVLRQGMLEHGLDNIDIYEGHWPLERECPPADVALMAHVGYDIEGFPAFLDAAEAAVSGRCLAIMRCSSATAAGHLLWHEIHGEPRIAYPMLEELVTLLFARGVVPEVTLTQRGTWGYDTRAELLEAARRQLWLRPGSAKDRRLVRLIEERSTERDHQWALDWSSMQDGIVAWTPRA